MNSNGSHPEGLDPQIADLMGIDEEEDSPPDFGDLFGENESTGSKEPDDEPDLTKESFPEIHTLYSDTPNPIFSSKEYYKEALSGEGEEAQRIHGLLAKFLNTQDNKEKSAYRQKLVPAYWNLAAKIAKKIHTKLGEPKKYLLRFGFLLPTVLTKEQRELISKVIDENATGEPVHYIDEWLYKVATGQIGQSAQDEVKMSQKNQSEKVLIQVEKARGNKKTQTGMIQSKMNDLEALEEAFIDKAKSLHDHRPMPEYDGLKAPYTPEQKSTMGDMGQFIKQMLSIDNEIVSLYSELRSTDEQLKRLEEQAEGLGASFQVDVKTISAEFNTVRQMTKMCAGRQGNHFPILMKQYFRPMADALGTRENVIRELDRVEKIDPEAFVRVFRQQANRIVPHIILVPSYGDRGVCWEPFEKYNRATSRGRVAVPMYPKDLRTAVISAVGDLRWQTAKEKAQHYWMEEGLTGRYYQWFTDRKMRGDVKEYFIQDYILWINKESEGTQKLDREIRKIFWRYIPFPQEIKDKLRTHGYVYEDLYKKDINRSMSDGY
ncbi:MAG: hypothetical protein ACLFMZ_02205 [Spirochaetaceae bacterium]